MATKKERRALRTILKNQFPFPFDVGPFIDRAIREFPQNPAAFAQALILNSKAFERRFPGIKKPDGTLRISPSEYISREEQFRSTAAQFGFGLSRAQMGGLVRRDVDPQEFTIRARGIQLVNTNPGTIDFLNNQINRINKARIKNGQPRIKRIQTKKDALDFFTGRADRQVYAIYEGALFQQAGQEAGIDISAGRASKIAGRTAGVLDIEQIEEGFASIAAQLRLANIELGAEGVTARELEILEFGGPGRGAIRQKAERILRDRQAQIQTDVVDRGLRLEDGRPIVA